MACMVAADHHQPVVYAHHPFAYAHHPVVYAHHPVVYTHPTNNCKNEAGQLVPCAHGVAPGSHLYSFPNAPLVPVVAQPAAEEPVAAEEPAFDVREDGLVDVKKREAEAEADPYLLYANYYGGYTGYYPYNYYGGYYGYYGHPYYAGYGCRNNYGALVPCA